MQPLQEPSGFITRENWVKRLAEAGYRAKSPNIPLVLSSEGIAFSLQPSPIFSVPNSVGILFRCNSMPTPAIGQLEYYPKLRSTFSRRELDGSITTFRTLDLSATDSIAKIQAIVSQFISLVKSHQATFGEWRKWNEGDWLKSEGKPLVLDEQQIVFALDRDSAETLSHRYWGKSPAGGYGFSGVRKHIFERDGMMLVLTQAGPSVFDAPITRLGLSCTIGMSTKDSFAKIDNRFNKYGNSIGRFLYESDYVVARATLNIADGVTLRTIYAFVGDFAKECNEVRTLLDEIETLATCK